MRRTRWLSTQYETECRNSGNSTRTLLGRLSESHTQRHERAVFLVNNIDKILTVFREGDVRIKLDERSHAGAHGETDS